MRVFEKYAKYYELFYRDKDYAAEADYLDKLFKRFQPNAQALLELGCGMGGHAVPLREKGYVTHGVDRSLPMLERARLVQQGGLTFSLGDIRRLDMEKIFDGVFSVFHVMSYQVTNEDVLGTFKSAARHLKAGGIFIFDGWYGPCVLNVKPRETEKTYSDRDVFVVRRSIPQMRPEKNLVDVKYVIHVKKSDGDSVEIIEETHTMRYFFEREIEVMLSQAGFVLEQVYKQMSFEPPDSNSWGVCFVARRNG